MHFTLKMLVSAVPVGLILLSLLLFKLYPIDEEKRRKNKKALQDLRWVPGSKQGVWGVCVGAGSDGLGHTVTCPGILQGPVGGGVTEGLTLFSQSQLPKGWCEVLGDQQEPAPAATQTRVEAARGAAVPLELLWKLLCPKADLTGI